MWKVAIGFYGKRGVSGNDLRKRLKGIVKLRRGNVKSGVNK